MKSSSGKKRMIMRYVRGLVFGMTAGTGATVLFVMAFAGIVVRTGSVPYGAIAPVTAAAAGVGALLGGYLCGRIGKRMGMAMGALCGLLMFLVLVSVGAASGGAVGTATLLRLVLLITAGALGGIAGVNGARCAR